MKIEHAQKLAKNVIPPDTQKLSKKQGAKKFDAVLSDTLNVKLSESQNHTKAVSGPQPLSPIDSFPIDREDVIGRVIKLLDIMDSYANKLGNPQVTLREISPLIAKIESESSQLKALAESLPPFDDIRPLLDEVLIRSSVEIIKYNRGDYI
ncbi:MAG: hypothetical protein N3B18_10050 [Desulfobacterota bacterium]|nr:hypothetical protein [Thermodesulfobacteriota bacterium]